MNNRITRTPHRGAGFCALLATLLALPLAAQAEEAAPAYTLTTNIGVFSQYIFRGISYTQEKPAVQGGIDFAHSSGAYLGIWGTNVDDAALPNAAGEIDVYGGFAKTVDDWTFDVGFLQFIFPGGEYNSSTATGLTGGQTETLNTLELNAAVTWKFIQLKYSYAVTDYFGLSKKAFGDDSDGSNYLEANVNYEFMPTWIVNLHVGHQKVKNYEDYNFTDWKVGVTKNFDGGWQAAVAYIDTNAKESLYTYCNDNGRDCKHTGDNKWLAYVKRTF
ncbi:TorF family putative porin [Methyloversatilis thermotolerans]|uniref:TorF family putative porin n=1 Tax=Methyloversatilis thermotolerans TaxID=1346290 RepID=UPI000366CA52